jgi:hypothetical protein
VAAAAAAAAAAGLQLSRIAIVDEFMGTLKSFRCFS